VRSGPDSRSDSHARGASPNIELFRTVLGIESAAPGFRRVRIRPHLGALAQASGSIPHPAGTLSLKLRMKQSKLEAEIDLPPGVRGEFEWRGSRAALEPGRKVLRLDAAK
jgi:alpha-L-rhamnosidase